MKKTKLVKVFESLTALELNGVVKFLDSPYFNKREDVKKLLNYLMQKKSYSLYSKEAAFKYVYTNESFDTQKFRLVCSYLFRLIEEFLIYEEMAKENIPLKFHLLRSYQKKNMLDSFASTTKDLNNTIDRQPFRDDEYWKNLYLLQYENTNFSKDDKRIKTQTFGEMADTFNVYTIASILKFNCWLIAQEDISNIVYDKDLLNQVLEYIKEHKRVLSFPAISIYFNFYQAMTTTDERYFQEMRSLIYEHQKKFPLEEIKNIYLLASNYCIKQANMGMNKYLSEYFQLNRAGLGQGFLLTNDMIDRFLFKNMVVVALKLNEFEQAKLFVETYTEKLHPDFQENLYRISNGKILYYERNYDEAQKVLVKFNSEDPLLILDAKYMLLKIYFEEKELEVLNPLINTIRSFLNRKREKSLIAESHYAYYKHVIRCSDLLLQIAYQGSNEKKEIKLKEEIPQLPLEADRNWFNEQLSKFVK